MLWKSSGRNARYTYFFHKLNFVSTLELNEKNSREFQKWCNYSCKYIIICVTPGQSLFILFYLGLILRLIYHGVIDSYSSFLIHLLWFVSTVLTIKTAGALGLTAFFFVLMVSVYLSLRFQQIYDDMRSFNRFGKIILKLNLK